MRYLIAILLPPLAVFLCGKPLLALLNVFLCALLWIPGVIHALMVVSSHKADIRMDRLAPPNMQRKQGRYGILIFLLLAVFLAIGIVSKWSGSKDDDPSNESESESEVANPEIPVKDDKGIGPQVYAGPAPEQIPEVVEKPLDLPAIQYPVTVVTTEKFQLLNEVGKEIPISVGTIIKIKSRSDLGTLKMTIGGKLFVGNESRLKGKIELK